MGPAAGGRPCTVGRSPRCAGGQSSSIRQRRVVLHTTSGRSVHAAVLDDLCQRCRLSFTSR